MTTMNLGDGASPELPFDIVSDIIIRLPVKSLCRFKCVSKAWLLLISNPKFAKKNLDLNKNKQETQSERLLYLSESYDCYSLDLESSDSIARQLRFRDEENPMKFKTISSSCNGLVMLFDLEFSIFLANPSTGECRKVPLCPFLIDSKSAVGGYGFGYDSSCDDYKVVNISLDGSGFEADENIVSVYNLKANSWRRIKSSPYRLLLFADLQGFFVNGALHWLGASDVIAFDLAREGFYIVPSLPYGVGQIEALDVFGDCLCGFKFKFDSSGHFNVWVMKEYGVRDSWVKFSMFDFPYSIRWMLPSMTGKLLLYTGTKIIAYDLEEGTCEELKVQDIHSNSYVTYEDSLIRLQEQYEYGEQNESGVTTLFNMLSYNESRERFYKTG